MLGGLLGFSGVVMKMEIEESSKTKRYKSFLEDKLIKGDSPNSPFKWVFYNQILVPTEIMIISQNPGPSPDAEECKDISNSKGNLSKLIKAYQDGLLRYIKNSKKNKLKECLKMIKEILKIDLELENLDPSIFNKIFFTDVVKKRGDELKPDNNDLKLLHIEIDEVDPKLIIAFGNFAWKFFADEIRDPTKIKKISGKLIPYPNEEKFRFYVIPMIHYSPAAAQKKEDYFGKLKKGLSEYNSLKEINLAYKKVTLGNKNGN